VGITHQGFDVGDLLRRSGGNHLAAIVSVTSASSSMRMPIFQ
jgi:hypothetical protein